MERSPPERPPQSRGIAIPRLCGDDRESRLDAVLAELLETGGDSPAARDAAFARHPDLADELREFLADHDRFKSPREPPPPARFGNYELIREIARGGMGVVWEAKQLAPPRPCAVKVLRAGEADEDDLARFRGEAAAAASLCHPHIAAVYDAGEVPPADGAGPPRGFLAMELVAGPNLAEYAGGSPLPAREAARLLADVADAVSHAHGRGVLHRDLKPANVLLDRSATRPPDGPPGCEPDDPGPPAPVAKVTDFGLAKRFAAASTPADATTLDAGLTRTGQIVGTPAYMSPEQAAATGEVGIAADVYGLGAILYHLLTGRAPFVDEDGTGPLGVLRAVLDARPLPPRSANPNASRALEAVCLRCLRKDPAARYGGAAEVAAEARRFLAGEPVLAARGGVAGLADRALTALTASRHEGHFRYWGNALLGFAAVVAAAHAAIFAADRAGVGFLAGHLLPGTAMLGGLVAVIWQARRKGHGVLPADGVERPIWAIWAGYLVARGMLTLLAWRQGWETGPTYAVAALLAGAAFHALGGHAWGACYLIAATFFAAALPLAAAGVWAVPAFGTLWTAVLVWLGLRYRRLDREAGGSGAKRTGPPRQSVPIEPVGPTSRPPGPRVNDSSPPAPPMTPALLLCTALAPTAAPAGDAAAPFRPDLPPPLPALTFSPKAPTDVFRAQGEPAYPTATPTGLLQADTFWFGQDDDSIAEVGDVEDGSAIRRLRLGAYGQAWRGVEYYLEIDFGREGGTALADTLFTLTDAVPGHDVRFGFFRQPVGFASRTPARPLPLLERPLPFALQPFRQVGVGINGSDEEYGLSWEGTVFRYPSDADGGVLGDRGGYSAAGRLNALLWEDDTTDSLIHTGISAAFLGPADDAIRYFSRPEVFSPESRGIVASTGRRAVPPFVDTTPLAAERSHVLGLELAGRRGPAYFISELNAVNLDPAERDQRQLPDVVTPGVDATRSAATFWGAHLTVGYFLTGEVRPYDLETATFGRTTPLNDFDPRAGKWGAVEILGRISHLDLTDNDDDFGGVRGGELTDLTAGANWYLNPRTRFQFNYISAFLSDRATGPGDGGDSQTDIFAVRAQVDF